jgi:hypothetical protein
LTFSTGSICLGADSFGTSERVPERFVLLIDAGVGGMTWEVANMPPVSEIENGDVSVVGRDALEPSGF